MNKFLVVFLFVGLSLVAVSGCSPQDPELGQELIRRAPYDGGLTLSVLISSDVTEDEMSQIMTFYAGSRSLDEYTYFFYIDRDPREDENWIADRIFEWYGRNDFVDCHKEAC